MTLCNKPDSQLIDKSALAILQTTVKNVKADDGGKEERGVDGMRKKRGKEEGIHERERN